MRTACCMTKIKSGFDPDYANARLNSAFCFRNLITNPVINPSIFNQIEPRLSLDQLKLLGRVRDAFCVSIYLEISHSEEKDFLYDLKIATDKASRNLGDFRMNPGVITHFLEPLRSRARQIDSAAQHGASIAIFVNNSNLRYFTLPIKLGNSVHVSHEFYLIPLFSLFNHNGEFFMLDLKLDAVNLYFCDRESIEKIPSKRLGALNIQNVIGENHVKKDVKKYCNEVAREVLRHLQGRKEVLIVSSVDYVFAMFRDAITYTNLHPKNIKAPSEDSAIELHEKAWEALKPTFDEHRKQKIARFREAHGTGYTSTEIREITIAAAKGKIDTLFLIPCGEDFFGVYDEIHQQVILDEGRTESNYSLNNHCAIDTITNGGEVLILDPLEKPDARSPIAALFRF